MHKLALPMISKAGQVNHSNRPKRVRRKLATPRPVLFTNFTVGNLIILGQLGPIQDWIQMNMWQDEVRKLIKLRFLPASHCQLLTHLLHLLQTGGSASAIRIDMGFAISDVNSSALHCPVRHQLPAPNRCVSCFSVKFVGPSGATSDSDEHYFEQLHKTTVFDNF